MKSPQGIIQEEAKPSLQEIAEWSLALRHWHERLAPYFARPEPHPHALLSLQLICQWSCWRRAHQYWAGYSHRRRREKAAEG